MAMIRKMMTRMKQSSGQRVVSVGVAFTLILSIWSAIPVHAAVVYRDVLAGNNAGGAASLSLSRPTGATIGDLFIAVVSVRGGTGTTITAPSGWTLINSNDSTTVLKSAVYYATYETAGASPYSFTFSASAKASGVVMAFSGVDVYDPVDVQGSQPNTSNTIVTAPSITTTVPNTMLVGAYSTATGTTFTAGSGMTLPTGAQSASTGGSGATRTTSGIQYLAQASAAVTGTKTITAGAGAVNVGHLIALRPSVNLAQASYRFFQNGDSTTVTTPLANADTPITIENGMPFRLRLNLGVASGGANATAAANRTFRLQYSSITDGTCDTAFSGESFSDVTTTSSNVRFYNNPTPVNGAAYSANATYDPVRAGITAIGQKYHEDAPSSLATAIPAGQDGLWDFALTTNGASFGSTFCFRVQEGTVNSNISSYLQIPQITIATPTVGQANYRFYANADSLSPGASLAAQDTAATIAPSTPFRLRQRLAVGSAQLPASNQNYKIQIAEKSGVCDTGFSGEAYGDMSVLGSSQAQYAGTAVNDTGVGLVAWSTPTNATGASNTSTASASTDQSNYTTNRLQVTGFGFNIPTSATITGITVKADRSSILENPPVTSADEFEIRLIKGGSTMGTDHRRVSTAWTNAAGDWGGSSDLWGLTWTPSDINASNFGVSLMAAISGDPINSFFATANVDSVQITVYYTSSVSPTIAYYSNPTAVDAATISSSGNDPTNGARPTVYQSYRESEPFSNNVAAIPNGSDGLWDFALTSDASVAGKTYCTRVVKSDGSLLDSYTQIPEITFSAPSGPTLDQQMRGGKSVINGAKGNLIW